MSCIVFWGAFFGGIHSFGVFFQGQEKMQAMGKMSAGIIKLLND